MPGQIIEDTLRLKDGRLLGYGLYGDPRGVPILDFHGIPGSRREAALMSELLGREDVCFIGVDRPGYGRSSPKRGFGIPDFPDDVRSLADHLHIGSFIALGYSGGGPFALACARFIPGRIAALGIVSGVGPAGIGSEGMHESNRKKFDLAQRLPWLARLMLSAAFSSLRRDPRKLSAQLERVWRQMPDPDRLALEDSAFSGGILDVTRDAILHSVRGWANEEVLMAQPWGFRLEDVRCPHIFLCHGGRDRNVPPAMGKAVAEKLPGCRAEFFEEEGHLSLLYNHGQEIIGTLVQAGRSMLKPGV